MKNAEVTEFYVLMFSLLGIASSGEIESQFGLLESKDSW